MSKSSEYLPVRVPNSLMRAMEEELERRENHPLYPAWTKSSFVLEAIREKIAHLQRSRARRRKTSKGINGHTPTDSPATTV